MILNPFAVLDLSLSLLRLPLAVLVVALAVRAWWRTQHIRAPEERKMLEDQTYFVYLLGLALLGLGVISWPLLYLLLQSYVPQWPGVMCVYGVMRIGAGSSGPSRFLPGLLNALELSKPALVFGAGCWFTLYLVNRRTATAPLARRVLAALVALGLLAGADAATEAAYLWIPKREESVSAGCCTTAFDDPAHGTWLVPKAVVGAGDRPLLTASFFATSAGMALGLYAAAGRARRRTPDVAVLLMGGVLALVIGAEFLAGVAAPVLLHLPYHHCPYDLIPQVPEAMVAVALFLMGTFSVGWAWVAQKFGDCDESRPFLSAYVGTILQIGCFGYLGSMVMAAVGLILG